MENTQRIKAHKISDINQKEIILHATNKKKTVPVTYGDRPFVIQTPFLEVTSDKLRPTAFPHINQLDTVFKGDTKIKTDQFFSFIEKSESNVCAQVSKKCAKWFEKKNITFKSLIRESDLNKNMYYIKWPIEMKEDMFITEHGEPFDPKKLKEKDCVRFIVEFPNIWIDEERIGYAYVVRKVMVRTLQVKIDSEYVFDSESSSQSDADDSSVHKITTILSDKTAVKNTRIPEVETHVEPIRTKKVSFVETPKVIPAPPQSLKVELAGHKKFKEQKNKYVVSDEDISDDVD